MPWRPTFRRITEDDESSLTFETSLYTTNRYSATSGTFQSNTVFLSSWQTNWTYVKISKGLQKLWIQYLFHCRSVWGWKFHVRNTCLIISGLVRRNATCFVLINKEMHNNSYNQFLFFLHSFSLHVSKESSRSSSAAQHSILYYTVRYNRYSRAGEYSCLSALHVSNESSRSSSGARHNILYYTVQSVQSCSESSC